MESSSIDSQSTIENSQSTIENFQSVHEDSSTTKEDSSSILDTSSRKISVSEIGEFIHHDSCERRFFLVTHVNEVRANIPFFERMFNPLDFILQRRGSDFENQWESDLQKKGFNDLTGIGSRDPSTKVPKTTWDEFARKIEGLSSGQCAYGREVLVEARIGAFEITGSIDFALVKWRDNEPEIILVECKASRKDLTYHRMQVILYRLLLLKMLESGSVVIGGKEVDGSNIRCLVVRIDEDTNTRQPLHLLEPIDDTSREEEDLRRLLERGGKLDRIARKPYNEIWSLDYQLEQKCDGCAHSVQCLPESSRKRRLELLSIDSSAIRVLRKYEVHTIDDLAKLDLGGDIAASIRADPAFTPNLRRLQEKARVRRKNLYPASSEDFGEKVYQVHKYKAHPIQSQLPDYPASSYGPNFIRVYLSVEYDYAENRIAGLSAHVTNSDWQLDTPMRDPTKPWDPEPKVQECQRDPVAGVVTRELDRASSRDILQPLPAAWTGDMAQDNARERDLLHKFLIDLLDELGDIAKQDEAIIHFYFWSPRDMKRLVDSCSRISSGLLHALNHLLGCREGAEAEQLIFSSLSQEIDNKYALAWTGRGLSVALSLPWFGDRYHWRRMVRRKPLDLDIVFTQDIFDFKTDLDINSKTLEWAKPKKGDKHRFEIRSRFEDYLTLPYWHAYWPDTPFQDPDDPQLDKKKSRILRNYIRAARGPRNLREYLTARVQGMRWLEERLTEKNRYIRKRVLNIEELRHFDLKINDPLRAGIDFLQLDYHVGLTAWIARHLAPPIERVSAGGTIPVANVMVNDSGDLVCNIDMAGFDLDAPSLRRRCSLTDESFVRLTPCDADPGKAQTIWQLVEQGSTCIIDHIDWSNGIVTLKPPGWAAPGPFTLPSRSYRRAPQGKEELALRFATIDESITDFVAPRVQRKLRGAFGNHVGRWFDCINPSIPEMDQHPDANRTDKIMDLVRSLEVRDGERLEEEQVRAIREGLEARIQLMQGPPGTGKTTTTAVSILARLQLRCQPGQIVIVAANTHTAVKTLLEAIVKLTGEFKRKAKEVGLEPVPIRIAKMHSTKQQARAHPLDWPIENLNAEACVTAISNLAKGSVAIIGGTTGSILKMAEEIWSKSEKYHALLPVRVVVVDEASMIVFPHFLAVAMLGSPDGQIMLAGDHRQLAPIVKHEWVDENRPPAVQFKPFLSAFQSVLNIKMGHPALNNQMLVDSKLTLSYRLPPEIADLIHPIYDQDGINLRTRKKRGTKPVSESKNPWERIWQRETGLFLVVHTEAESRTYNHVEAEIVQALVNAGGHQKPNSIALITPYRAQRSQLEESLGTNKAIYVIDTVERLQGGETENVIVSATASDPSAISSNVEFLMNLNRTNVAFSRSLKRLIVVCSKELLDFIPSEMERYDSAKLWKSLRDFCTDPVGTADLGDYKANIFEYSHPSKILSRRASGRSMPDDSQGQS